MASSTSPFTVLTMIFSADTASLLATFCDSSAVGFSVLASAGSESFDSGELHPATTVANNAVMAAVNNGRLKKEAVDLLDNKGVGIMNSVYQKMFKQLSKIIANE